MKPASIVVGAMGLALTLAGYASSGTTRGAATQTRPAGRLLLDSQSGTTSRAHCTNVDDPFGGGGKVIHGEVVEEGKNKTTFLNGKGFFAVPPEWRGEVVVRYAVRKEATLRIALVSADGVVKSYYFTAPKLETWCEAVLPLKALEGKDKPGDKITDISVWQQGGGKEAGLWVDRVTLRGELPAGAGG